MARHDREESLEEQLAWLDAIKETEESPVSVSASTASADEPVASPYPQDPWKLVPQQHETPTPPLFRAAADSVYGTAAAEDVPEGESEAAEWLGETGTGSPATTDEPAARPADDPFTTPLKPLPRPDDTETFTLSFTPPEPAAKDKAAEPADDPWPTPPEWPPPAELSASQPPEQSATPSPSAGSSAGLKEGPAEDPSGEDAPEVRSPAAAEEGPRAEEKPAEQGPRTEEKPSWDDKPGWESSTLPRNEPPKWAGSDVSQPRDESLGWAGSDETLPRNESPRWTDSGPHWAASEQRAEPEERPQPEERFQWTEPVQEDRSQRQDRPMRLERSQRQNRSAHDDPLGGGLAHDGSQRDTPPHGDPLGGGGQHGRAAQEGPRHDAGRRAAEQEGSPWGDQPEWRPAERDIPPPRRRPAPAHVFSAPPRPPVTGRPTADSLDPESLLRGRRNAPSKGWRRVVYKASGGWIKPGEPPEVRRRRELVTRARTPVTAGHHRVAVLSLKGGVGKTTTTVGLGATLAQIRGDRVIAVDANPDRGTLSDKLVLETSATVRDLLNERDQVRRYVDIRAFTSQAGSRLEVLASDRDPSVSEAFSGGDYQAVSQVLENFYSICITDCGTGLLHSAMGGVLGLADQIVLVSSPSVDGARAASATLDWLEAHQYGDLVKNATVVLCSVRPRSKSAVDIKKLEAHFAARCRAVIRVPYDPHLEEGAEMDLDRLQETTRDSYLQLAACVGDGFAGLPE
ncbi:MULTISPECIES: MinD/ParA family ATP-binding protein [unclassified Nonomuraea]|uniref:MinD/ParA family ATP-binding protein n=1 Tax=unclassified Nonomuraea TaxID=2593643 RepID=UPI00207BB6EB|nr:AAA family ATPase [Nonomuraea sp. KC401]